jgi:hypothetical protein
LEAKNRQPPSSFLSDRRAHAIELSLLCAGVAIVMTTFAPIIHSDGMARFEAVRDLMRGVFFPTKYSLIQPALTALLAYVGRFFYIGSWSVASHFNIVVFLSLAVPIWFKLVDLYGSRVATRALLLLLGASMLPHHLLRYYGEVLSAMAIATGFLYARDRPAWAVVSLAIGVANTPVLVVPVGTAALVLLRRAPAVAVGTVVAAALIAAEMSLRVGMFWNSPYLAGTEKGYPTVLPYSGLPGFSYPVFFGVLSVLFSFGKGLVWFIPGLLTLFDRTLAQRLRVFRTPAGWALAAFSISIVLVYSRWWAWYGGDFWGPRFFLILSLPASLALAVATISPATTTRLWLALLVLTLSVWVGLNGAVFGQQSMDVCWANNYELEFMCWYVPEFSALWRPFVTHGLLGLPGAIWSGPQNIFALWQVATWSYLAWSLVRQHRYFVLTPR